MPIKNVMAVRLLVSDSKKKILIYCLDQNHDTAVSMGIFNYTRKLISALGTSCNECEITVLVSSENREQFCACVDMADSVEIRLVRGRFSAGWRRFLADHVLAQYYARRERADYIFYPKGWPSLWNVSGVPFVCMLHDTINDLGQRERPSVRDFFRRVYFGTLQYRAVRHAHRIVTNSHASKEALCGKFDEKYADKIQVAHLGPGLDCETGAHGVQKSDNTCFVMGSRIPHKCTAETIDLLIRYSRKKGVPINIRVCGLNEWPEEFGSSPEFANISFLGRVDDLSLMKELSEARALFFLSKVEGFGLPLIESYYLGTPVVFRDVSALAEVMAGIPGGWTGGTFEEFCCVVDEIMGFSEQEIAGWADVIRSKYNWEKTAQLTARCFR